MFGALYLAIIAIAPIVTGAILGQSGLAIGGTSIIIVVSVALETTKAWRPRCSCATTKASLSKGLSE